MPRIGVTKADVLRAKTELEAAGKRVSCNAIIAHLGTGSSSTVTPLLAELRREDAEVAATTAPKAASPVPADVIEKMTELAKQSATAMYRVLAEPVEAMARQKDDQIQAERRDMQAEVDQALSELAQANTRNAELQDMANAGTARAAELAERLARVEDARREEAQRHADETRLERAQHLEELGRERAQRAETVDLMRQQSEQLRSDLQHERSENARITTRCDDLANELQDLRTKLAGQQQATAAAERDHRAECDQHQRTRDDLNALREELNRERAERTREREELRGEVRTLTETSRTTEATLRADAAGLRERLDTALAEAAELRGRMAALTPSPSNSKKTS